MYDYIEYLKGPELVIKVQEYFGVKYLNKENTLKNIPNGKNLTNIDYYKLNNTNNDNSRNCHNRNASDCSTSSSTNSTTADDNEINHENEKKLNSYEITNKFWYYLFVIGTSLGDEIFYATFLPFWFWNIDGAVGRRVVFVWALVMYVGQGFKDIIRWPRPGPPVKRLQKKWALEYGMPSTHAMVAISIPFSVLIYTMDRYQYNSTIGFVFAIVWCLVICFSRIYLGMHSVLDIIAGIMLTILLMVPLIPLVDYLDKLILECLYSPLVVLTISILMIVYYPDSDRWTPTRGDTTLTISFCAGIHIGAWLNYQMGYMIPPQSTPPYEIIWPSHVMMGFMLLRTVLGLCCVVATRAIGKFISYAFICALLGRDKNELRNSENSLENKHKTIVELCYKYFACALIGINTQYLLPNVFKMLGIGRPDFYTEF